MSNSDSYEKYDKVNLESMRNISSSLIIEKQLRKMFIEQQKKLREQERKKERLKKCKCLICCM